MSKGGRYGAGTLLTEQMKGGQQRDLRGLRSGRNRRPFKLGGEDDSLDWLQEKKSAQNSGENNQTNSVKTLNILSYKEQRSRTEQEGYLAPKNGFCFVFFLLVL